MLPSSPVATGGVRTEGALGPMKAKTKGRIEAAIKFEKECLGRGPLKRDLVFLFDLVRSWG